MHVTDLNRSVSPSFWGLLFDPNENEEKVEQPMKQQ